MSGFGSLVVDFDSLSVAAVGLGKLSFVAVVGLGRP